MQKLLEAGFFRADGVTTGQQELHQIVAGRIGGGLGRGVPFDAGNSDDRAGNDGPRRVRDLSGNACAKFLSRGRNEADQSRDDNREVSDGPSFFESVRRLSLTVAGVKQGGEVFVQAARHQAGY